jgi:hypothetical protein
MDLFPARRGCLHFGAVTLAIVFAAFGLAFAVWGSFLGAKMWSSIESRAPRFTEAQVLANPQSFVETIQGARKTNFHALKAAASFCAGASRFLAFVVVLTIFSAATTPGSRLRKRAWWGIAGMAAVLLLFHVGAGAAPPGDDFVDPPVPTGGREIYQTLVTALGRMKLTVRAFCVFTVVMALFFGTITCRSALRLWRGIREEHSRLQKDSEALLVSQF